MRLEKHQRDMILGAVLLTFGFFALSLFKASRTDTSILDSRKSSSEIGLEVDKLNSSSLRLYKRGEYDAAIDAAREALAIDGISDAMHVITLTTLRNNLAMMLYERGHYEEPKSILEGNIELIKDELVSDNGFVHELEINLAKFYIHHREYETAKSYYLPAMKAYEEKYPEQYEATGHHYFELGQIYSQLGSNLEAEATFLKAISSFDRMFDSSGKYNFISNTYRQLGHLSESHGKNQDAVRYFTSGLSLAEDHIGKDCEIAGILRKELKNPNLYSGQ